MPLAIPKFQPPGPCSTSTPSIQVTPGAAILRYCCSWSNLNTGIGTVCIADSNYDLCVHDTTLTVKLIVFCVAFFSNSEQFLPTQHYASKETSYNQVTVSVSVTSQRSIEMAE